MFNLYYRKILLLVSITLAAISGLSKGLAGNTERDRGLYVQSFEQGDVNDHLLTQMKEGNSIKQSSNEILCLKGHTDSVNGVAFSPDGICAVSASSDGTIRLWDIKTGKEIRQFETNGSAVNCIVFFPDGKRALSGHDDGNLYIWDVNTGLELSCLKGHNRSIKNIALSSDGLYAVSTELYSNFLFWNIGTGEQIQQHSVKKHELINCVAFSPDNSKLAAVTGSISSERGRTDILLHGTFAGSMLDGYQIEGMVYVWTLERSASTLRSRVTKQNRVDGPATCLVFSPDSQHLLFSGVGWVKVWDFEENWDNAAFQKNLKIQTFPQAHIEAADSKEQSYARLVNNQLNEYTDDKEHAYRVSCLAFSPSGRRILSGGYNKTLCLWDAETKEKLSEFSGHTEPLKSVAFSPDGRLAISGSEDSTVRIWRLSDEETSKDTVSIELSPQDNQGKAALKASGVAQTSFNKRIQEIKEKANQGDANAQYNLAIMYYEGQGTAQDYKQAFKWFTKAAEQGLAEAQNNLGLMYSEGKGITRNYQKTFEWYTKAAEQGLPDAQNNLGTIYRTGKGVARDNKQAVKWYRQAAEQGHAEAQNNLGSMYNNGLGVAQDYRQAFEWYKKAAEQGNALAQSNLGQMYDTGQGVARDHKQAVKWFKKSAQQGNFLGQYNLALLYYNGRGVSKDYVEAYKWATIAANSDKSATPFKTHLKQHMSSSQIAEAERKAREFAPILDIPFVLHKAAEQNNIALVKSLIEKGANVNVADQLGWSPLHYAAYRGHKQTAELLLNNGAIVNAKANNDVRPLHLAVEQGQTALAELLLGKGADVNAQQVQGWTPLGLAAQKGHLETVKLLLDKGAEVNSKSKSGLTPLHTAVSKGCREVIELLLSKGAEVNSKSNNGRTPLHTAAYQNQLEAAKLLLSAGADPNIKDIAGKTPIDFATDFGNVTMTKLLAKTTTSPQIKKQQKTTEGLPIDGIYSKDIGSGGSYKDPIHGFFEVEPPKGFKIVEQRDRTTTRLDNGTVVPCSRIRFQSDKARFAVVTRKAFKGTIEEDSKIVVNNLRSAGAKIATERFVTIDGSKGIEVGSIAGGYRLLLLKYKKYGLDHAITMSCSPADFSSFQKEFTDFLRSYRSLKPK